ncbi:urea ABC transporter substrate-binding protein [Methylogaea oryzae]|uniref:urea ABC transporter substrate-binding protein n=1 Tax=Methylogaea oryzae TaxID=1295382 RepID=UPI001C8244B7|nr:urea ABC transporter substrate-binding protein [Methylogaea oryzae]
MRRPLSNPFAFPRWAVWSAAAVVAGLLVVAALGRSRPPDPIRIGVLHSLTGTMAVSEAPLVDAVQLAVDEINAEGGVLGRPLAMVVADGRSDERVFAAEAERLIVDEKVSALFACWTSACRKAVKPVVERHRHLMFYPVQYEGLEQSPNILYAGAAPNQQIVPGVRWAMEQFGPRIYLVGSDYIFPLIANLIIRDLSAANGGEIVGERYVPLGTQDFAEVAADIQSKKPDVVLNTLNGDSNAGFFAALEKAGLADAPLVSFSVAEVEIGAWGGARLTHHYGIWNYFQSLPGEANRVFVANFKSRFGADRVTSDPMEAAHIAVHLWAQAAQEGGSPDPDRVNSATLLRQTLSGPSGTVAVDPSTRHLWKMVRVGRVRPDGQFEQVAAAGAPLRPAPWPLYRVREDWQLLVDRLSAGGAP